MMNKTLRHFLAVFLCFCMICSLCGVGFAAVDDGFEGADVSLSVSPDVDSEPPTPDPDPPTPDSEPPAPDSEPPSPDPEPPAPDPDPDSDTPFPAPDDGEEDPDVSPSPEPDTSAPSASVAAPVVVPPPDVTYVELPEDYVIKSAALEDMYAIDPQSALAPVTPSNTSGLKSVLLSILGNYDPIVAEYQYVGSGSYNNYIREIQPDYVWLSSAAIFAILLYCTWRILGGLVCRK